MIPPPPSNLTGLNFLLRVSLAMGIVHMYVQQLSHPPALVSSSPLAKKESVHQFHPILRQTIKRSMYQNGEQYPNISRNLQLWPMVLRNAGSEHLTFIDLNSVGNSFTIFHSFIQHVLPVR